MGGRGNRGRHETDVGAAVRAVSRPSPAELGEALRLRNFKRELSPEDWRRLLADIDDKSEERPRQIVQWARGTLATTERMATEPAPDNAVASLFWVRLYGVLKDLAEALTRHARVARAFKTPERAMWNRSCRLSPRFAVC